MFKVIRAFDVAFKYVSEHARAHYTIDGEHFFNGGDACEMAVKSAFGLNPVKDSNGAFDVSDDIAEFNASVKSSAATLVNRPIGNDFDSILDAYFAQVHSNNFWYVTADFNRKMVTVYQMNADEFRDYLKRFSRFDPKRKVIRLNKDADSKNLHWLNLKSVLML